jgi:hypothetical protein
MSTLTNPGGRVRETRRSPLAWLGGGAALTACGVGRTEPAASGPAGGAPATVEYGQTWGPDSAPEVQDWLERFNLKHAGRVTVVQGDQGDDDVRANPYHAGWNDVMDHLQPQRDAMPAGRKTVREAIGGVEPLIDALLRRARPGT